MVQQVRLIHRYLKDFEGGASDEGSGKRAEGPRGGEQELKACRLPHGLDAR